MLLLFDLPPACENGHLNHILRFCRRDGLFTPAFTRPERLSDSTKDKVRIICVGSSRCLEHSKYTHADAETLTGSHLTLLFSSGDIDLLLVSTLVPAFFLFDASVAKSFRRATARSVETFPAVSDFIHIEQLEVSARVGVTDAERDQPQQLTVSMTMWPRRRLIDLDDDIRNTINYSEVCNATKDFLRDCSCKLIEKLADRLAMHLLKQFPLRKVTVELRKFVLPDTKFVAVTITRSAVIS